MSNNWDQFKVRCSAINRIMAKSQSNPILTEKNAEKLAKLESKSILTDKDKEEMAKFITQRENSGKLILGDGCITYLMEVYAWEKYGMIPISKESLDMAQIKKGQMQEGEARVLLSFVDDCIYMVHKERISNEFISGEIDLYLGESVMEATNITDIKNSWDYPTFLKKIHTGLESGQEQQVQGYCDITGAKEGWIANCLVDAPDEVIEKMKWTLVNKMNSLTIESPEFLDKWQLFEHSMRFNQIPPHQRVSKIKIEPFSEFERQATYDRVKVCREWLFNFEERYEMLNK